MTPFYLYRLKIIRPEQSSIFDDTKTLNRQIIYDAFYERPHYEVRKGHTWRIGNLEEIDKNSLLFALGRERPAILERFDEKEGNFREEALEEAPYTYGIIDLELQVCALAHRDKIAQKVSSIANNLVHLLNLTTIAVHRGISFIADGISDPSEFIEYIERAYSVQQFEMGFGLPNPFDVEKDFHKPMQNYLRSATGEKGKTVISGSSLNGHVIGALAKSAAATGNDASARLVLEKGAKPIFKRLSGNPAIVRIEDLDTLDRKKELINSVRAAYRNVRGEVTKP